MKIVEAWLQPYSLPLVRPWAGARETIGVRHGVLLALRADDGLIGYGDCAPLPSSGEARRSLVIGALRAIVGDLRGRSVATAFAETGGGEFPEATWALETALYDLRARALDIPLARLLNSRAGSAIKVNAALGALDAGVGARAQAALASGYSTGKIKVGVGGVDVEIGLVHELAAQTGGRLRLRLDANCAWSASDARRFLLGIRDLPVECVEEPLAEPTLGLLAQLQALATCALAVDESLSVLGPDALFRARAVQRLVLKPARAGGVSATLRLADRARAAGMELVLTSVVDSAIGVVAAAHLAAALAAEQTHGLATLEWLREDVAPRPPLADGALSLPAGAGLGVAPHPNRAG